MLGGMSDENIGRIKRQNERKISLIIGNPPYFAHQENENQNNKSRAYDNIDDRIRFTYEAKGDLHKSKSYDMYSRFLRWASDRLGEEGVVAFVVNRSFVEKRSFEGFRLSVFQEFSAIEVVDLFGDVRDADKHGGNVFPNKVGTAIIFLVRKYQAQKTTVTMRGVEIGPGSEKLSLLATAELNDIPGHKAAQAAEGNWLGQDGVFEGQLLLVPAKLSGTAAEKTNPSVFAEASFGFVSNRDDWVISRDSISLAEKLAFYLTTYRATVDRLSPQVTLETVDDELNYSIKWTEDLRRYAIARKNIRYNAENDRPVLYRLSQSDDIIILWN